jgi:MFS family permease
MFFLFIIIAFSVLMISLSISFISYLFKLRENRETTNSYLFAHNSPLKATLSNIGSILSLTTLLGVFASAIVGWGWIIIIGIFIGVAIGYILFWITVNKMEKAGRLPEPLCGSKTNTILDIVNQEPKDESATIQLQSILRVLQILLYVSVLILEFSLARFLLEKLFPESGLLPVIALLFLTILCATYTSVGGFIGVLRTDIFQIILFGLGLYSLLFIYVCSDIEILPIIKNALNTNYIVYDFFTIRNCCLYFSMFSFTIAYNFSWPDLWVRNISTLERKTSRSNRSNINSTPLIAGWAGIFFFIFPVVLYALSILIDKEHLIQRFDLMLVLDDLINALAKRKHYSFYLFAVLCVFGGTICVFITSVDTWLIGIAQHLPIQNNRRGIAALRLWIFCFSIFAVILSLFLIKSEDMFFTVGLIGSLVLFGNFGIVLRSAFRFFTASILTFYLKLYLILGVISIIICGFVLDGKVSDNAIYAAVFQIVSSLVLLFFLPKGHQK